MLVDLLEDNVPDSVEKYFESRLIDYLFNFNLQLRQIKNYVYVTDKSVVTMLCVLTRSESIGPRANWLYVLFMRRDNEESRRGRAHKCREVNSRWIFINLIGPLIFNS